jgi:hypothetical protein
MHKTTSKERPVTELAEIMATRTEVVNRNLEVRMNVSVILEVPRKSEITMGDEAKDSI